MINNNEMNSPDLINNIRTPNLIKRKHLGLSRNIIKRTVTPTVTNISNEINTPDNTQNKILEKCVHTNPDINKSTPLVHKSLPFCLRKSKITKINNKLTKKKLNFGPTVSQSILSVKEHSEATLIPPPKLEDKEISEKGHGDLSLANLFETYGNKSCEEIKLEISRIKEENIKKRSELTKIECQEKYITELKEETEIWKDGFYKALELLANKMEIDQDTILNNLNIPLDIAK